MVLLKVRFSKTAETMKNEAELKFKTDDFESALKFANMAREYDPKLNGVQQCIAAYTVHYIAACTASAGGCNNKRKFNDDDDEIDWYAILGVSDDKVDTETIRKQYKKMAIMVHPDKNNSVAAKGAFTLISDAWNMLSNESSRKAYDRRSGRDISKRRMTSSSTTSVHYRNKAQQYTSSSSTYANGTTHTSPPAAACY